MAQRIIITDDHPLMRAAIRTSVERVWPDHEIVEVPDAASAQLAVDEGHVELVTLDLHMADSAGLGPLLELRKSYPAVPVVVISASDDPRVIGGARDLGAAGFIPKTASLEDMTGALELVRDGDLSFPDIAGEGGDDSTIARLASLTPAQTRILHFVAQGLLNKQIAHEMDISEATVKAHITAIFRRLGVTNRTQATLLAKDLDAAGPM